MIGYASATGTKRNLTALRDAGWGLLVSASGHDGPQGFERYALDNGAWSAFLNQTPWDRGRFEQMCARYGNGAAWVVVPDVVADARATLERAAFWLPRLDHVAARRLIAVQDGMVPDDVRAWLGQHVGLFVGGSTAWKLKTMPVWGELASEAGCYLHVGRVNTARRIAYCAAVGADSFDGTSATRYSKNLPRLDVARRQGTFKW